ncbi:MAG: hypothetical protein KGL39_26045 [Patescibacteria group bacterium]|nr:hypothetical protein [Patescibacteria group bacterium]
MKPWLSDSFDLRDYGRARRGPAALLATRCCKGNSSSSQPTTISTAPGGQATGGGAVAGGSGSLNVGQSGTYLEQGSTDFRQANLANIGATQNSGNKENVGNTSISGGVTSTSKDVSGTDLSGANLSGLGSTTTTTNLAAGAKQVGGNDLSGASFNITDNGAVKAATDLAGRVVDAQSSTFNNALSTLTAGGAANLDTLTTGLDSILQSANGSNNAALQTLSNEFASQQQTESQNLQTINGTVTGVLGHLNSLQQSQAAGAGSQLLTTIEYIALALAGVFGIWLLFGKKAH